VALRPTIGPPPAQAIGIRAAAHVHKPRLVAARLDRSNFRILTSPAQIAKSTSGSLGPAAAPIRAAARAAARRDLVSLAFADGTTLVSRFSASSASPDEKRFSGAAVQALPRYEATAARTDVAHDTFN
jgi:hypothetical protein